MAVTAFNRSIWVALAWLVAGGVQAQVTELTATVDKNPAMADEAVQLVVTANGDADREAFDPSALLKDFVVGRTSVSSQTQIINFNTSRTTTWTTRLIPRQAGRYQIPAFTVDGVSSQPIALDVIPVSAAARRQAQSDVFVTTEVDRNTLYLQQQFVYTAKLHLAIDLQRGSLAAPELEGSDIRQLGKDKETSEIINGKRYRVIERNFAVIPQQSGRFTIAGPLFEGEVVDNSRQSFALFNRTRTISRIGEAVEIDVRPIPSNYNDQWLPSELVQLSQEWQPATGEYRVGEPITRIITLTAAGSVEEQLPQVQGTYPDGLKVYPDQANSATVEHGNKLVAQRTESIALIPSKSGELRLPPIQVPWFNVATGQTEYASLPAETLSILPATGDAAPTPTGSLDAQPAVKPDQDSSVLPPTAAAVATPWWSLSSSVLMVLWLATLGLWWRSRSGISANAIAKQPEPDETEKQAWLSLLKVIKTNDKGNILNALTLWLSAFLKRPGQSLQKSVMLLANADVSVEIEALMKSRFSKAEQPWNGQTLLRLLQELRKTKTSREQTETGLKPLYPG